MGSNSAPKSQGRNSDIDFNDVFGGPPRRPSGHESRYSFGENTDSSSALRRSDETVAPSRNPWSSLSEKPVFGFGEQGMSLSRRRYPKFDFFGDIFRGNIESLSSSPRKDDQMKDLFTPEGSKLFSPVPAEPFGSSFPAQFSRPSKLNKGIALPTFGSPAQMESTNGNSKDDSNSSEMGSQFHFSIYKWANKGSIPFVFAPRKSDRLKEKDKLQRCSSANGWIASDQSIEKENLHIYRMPWNAKSCRVELDKNKNGFIIDPRNEDGEPDRIIEEHYIFKSESEIVSSTDKNISGDIHPHVGLSDKRVKEVYAVGKETHKSHSKTPNLLFNNDELGNDSIIRNAGTKDVSIKSTKKLYEILGSKKIKKEDEKRKASSNSGGASKTSVKHSARKSWDNGKARVRGKFKEFIRIFNQDVASKPRADPVFSKNHSSRWKERDTMQPENESSIITTDRDEKIQMQKKKSSPGVPAANHVCNGASEKNINSSVKGTVSDGSKTIVEDPADSLEDNFMIEELTPEDKILPQFGIGPEEIKAIDAKIQQWSNGKQGNIRSLLSTLQYILWSDSGWKAVPLVDIIEGPAVKRSYQKALLCLHPDKLQQKGASSDKKYIAEKVFDILQDAWTHFNSLGSM